MWGSGNEVTNSLESVSFNYYGWEGKSVSEAQKAALESLQEGGYSGGSVLAVGGGNKADYAYYSQLLGVQNKVLGSSADEARYVMVDGYKNTVKEASNVTVIGTHNTVEAGADGNVVIGDYRTIAAGKTGNVILGAADEETTANVSDSVILGRNANSEIDGAVALGAGSLAVTEAGVAGYDPLTGLQTTRTGSVWVSDLGAVSVGGNGHTRQITNLAAGTADTDAVNVAQLRTAVDALSFDFSAGENIKITTVTDENGRRHFTISAIDNIESGDKIIDAVNKDKDASGSEVVPGTDGAGESAGSAATDTGPQTTNVITAKVGFEGDSGDKVTLGGNKEAPLVSQDPGRRDGRPRRGQHRGRRGWPRHLEREARYRSQGPQLGGDEVAHG